MSDDLDDLTFATEEEVVAAAAAVAAEAPDLTKIPREHWERSLRDVSPAARRHAWRQLRDFADNFTVNSMIAMIEWEEDQERPKRSMDSPCQRSRKVRRSPHRVRGVDEVLRRP